MSTLNELERMKVLTVGFLCCTFLGSPVPAQQPPTVADLPALTNLVNSGWATNQFMAKAAPPGLARFNHDLGIVAAGGDFFTNLPFVVSLDITNYPLTILETNTSPRTRIYLDATGGIFQTLEVPAGHTSNGWSTTVYGSPGPWLTASELSQWYAERDPARQHVTLSLISTSDVPAYLAALTNAIGNSDGGTGTPILILFSNDTLIVKTTAAESFRTMYLHAPASVTGFTVYTATDLTLLVLGAWNLAARLPHNNDPLAYNYLTTASNIFFTLGTDQDSDGDGLSDSDEVLLHGTSHQTADTDGDGLSDRDERMNYGSMATNYSSANDGLGDGWKVANHFNPNAYLNSSFLSANGLTYAQLNQIGAATNAPVIDLGPNDVVMDYKSYGVTTWKVGWKQLDWDKDATSNGIPRFFLNRQEDSYHRVENYEWVGEQGCIGYTETRYTWTGLADALWRWSPAILDATHVHEARHYCGEGSDTHSIGHWEQSSDGGTGTIINLTVYGGNTYTNDPTGWNGTGVPGGGGLPGSASTTNNVLTPTYSRIDGHDSSEVVDDGETNTLHANSYHQINLTQEFTTTDLLTLATNEHAMAPAITNLDWNTGITRSNSYVCLTNTTPATNALRLLAPTETNINLTRIQYRLRLTNSITGTVYRATVAHVFTGTNGTSSVIAVKTFIGLGTGSNLVLKEDGAGYDVTIEPPGSNGVVAPKILRVGFVNPSQQSVSRLSISKWLGAFSYNVSGSPDFHPEALATNSDTVTIRVDDPMLAGRVCITALVSSVHPTSTNWNDGPNALQLWETAPNSGSFTSLTLTLVSNEVDDDEFNGTNPGALSGVTNNALNDRTIRAALGSTIHAEVVATDSTLTNATALVPVLGYLDYYVDVFDDGEGASLISTQLLTSFTAQFEESFAQVGLLPRLKGTNWNIALPTNMNWSTDFFVNDSMGSVFSLSTNAKAILSAVDAQAQTNDLHIIFVTKLKKLSSSSGFLRGLSVFHPGVYATNDWPYMNNCFVNAGIVIQRDFTMPHEAAHVVGDLDIHRSQDPWNLMNGPTSVFDTTIADSKRLDDVQADALRDDPFGLIQKGP